MRHECYLRRYKNIKEGFSFIKFYIKVSLHAFCWILSNRDFKYRNTLCDTCSYSSMKEEFLWKGNDKCWLIWAYSEDQGWYAEFLLNIILQFLNWKNHCKINLQDNAKISAYWPNNRLVSGGPQGYKLVLGVPTESWYGNSTESWYGNSTVSWVY